MSSKSQIILIGQSEAPKPILQEANKPSAFDISSAAAIIAAFAAIGTFIVTWRQLGKVAKSLDLQADAIKSTAESLNLQRLSTQATVILDCSKHYDNIVSAIQEYEKNGQIELWWYRLWDLHTKEFFFYKNGLINKEIYEVWMIELAFRYEERPFGYNDMYKFRESHKKYLDSRISPTHHEINDFFAEIYSISKRYSFGESASDKIAITKAVNSLINHK
jgi:hypothetical protein